MRFTILSAVKNSYELTRQLVESILSCLDGNEYSKVILMDDFSDPKGKLREYLEYLKTNEKFLVVTKNEYRHAHFYQYGWMQKKRQDDFFDYSKFTSDKPSMGHPLSVMEGLKLVKTEFVFIVDMDCFFTEQARGLFKEMEKLFDDNPKVMSIGDGNSHKELVPVVLTEMKRITNQYGRARVDGYVGSPATAVRMNAFTEHALTLVNPVLSLDNQKPGEKVSGSLFGQFGHEVFCRGLYAMHFPIFGKGRVVHLGRAVIKRDAKINIYPFLKEWSGEYSCRLGPNILEDWRGGRFAIDMKQAEYDSYLKEKYSKPFDQIQPLIPDNLLKPVDGEVK